jgi:hypothetical protein
MALYKARPYVTRGRKQDDDDEGIRLHDGGGKRRLENPLKWASLLARPDSNMRINTSRML